MNENDTLAEQITQAIAGATDEADAIARLRKLGCSPETASLYAAHHFDTHRGDVIDHGKEKP